MKTKEYIHYGNSHFKKELWKPIKNKPFRNKPVGGLWASAVDAELGWKDWSEYECFNVERLEKSFRFTLSENANVLHVYSKADLENVPMQINSSKLIVLPNFEEMIKQGYDAIELHLSEDKAVDESDSLYWLLYGWDCDSILIFNPDIIIEKENSNYGKAV